MRGSALKLKEMGSSSGSGGGGGAAAGDGGGGGRMEGWLYLIRSNRIGLQFSRKRYFVLDGHHLRSFKSVPLSNNQVHHRSLRRMEFQCFADPLCVFMLS